MSHRNVLDFSGPEMSTASLKLFTRARSLSVAALLVAFFTAALIS